MNARNPSSSHVMRHRILLLVLSIALFYRRNLLVSGRIFPLLQWKQRRNHRLGGQIGTTPRTPPPSPLTAVSRWVGGGAESTDSSIDTSDSEVNATTNITVNISTAEETNKRSSIFLQLPQLPEGRRRTALEMLDTTRRVTKRISQAFRLLQTMGGRFGPSVLTLLSLAFNYNGSDGGGSVGTDGNDGISFVTLYSIALLGSSCGFHTFLYFITVGYAMGVAFPLIVALGVYLQQSNLPRLTVLHSSLTIVWGIRLVSFLLLREYVMWPALHQKVVELQSRMKIPFASKLLCWFVYSFFYLALMASCWCRLLQAPLTSLSSSSSSEGTSNLHQWGPLGYVGLSVQVGGLLLETVADWQKTSFKSRYRHSWCNVGVWKYSTHPHYLGEGLFWIGTYLANGFHSVLPSSLATFGLAFLMTVLKGAARSLAIRQKEKYGQEAEFCSFQRTHNVFGPKYGLLWKLRLAKQREVVPQVKEMTLEETASGVAEEQQQVHIIPE